MCGALSQYLVTTTVRPSVSAKLKVEKPVSMPACEIISRSIAIAPSIAACSSAGVRRSSAIACGWSCRLGLGLGVGLGLGLGVGLGVGVA